MNQSINTPAAFIRMYCNSAYFFLSICDIKPPHRDKDGKFNTSFTQAMEPFSVDKENIISINKVEDCVKVMHKIESDPFIWFVVALSFMHYYFGDCAFNIMFSYNQKAILKLSIEYVKENVVKDAYPYAVYLDGDLINEKGEKLEEVKDLTTVIDKEKLSQIRKNKDLNVSEVINAMDLIKSI